MSFESKNSHDCSTQSWHGLSTHQHDLCLCCCLLAKQPHTSQVTLAMGYFQSCSLEGGGGWVHDRLHIYLLCGGIITSTGMDTS